MVTRSPDMAKKTKKGDPLALPSFLNRKDPDTIAVVEAGKVAYLAERREAAERRAVERAKVRKLEAANPKKVAAVKATKKAKVAKPVSKPTKPVKAAKSKMSDVAVITVLVDSFPHRAGSQAEAKSALLKTGMTVAEYQAAGAGLGLKGNWHLAHIKYCVNYKLISVEA